MEKSKKVLKQTSALKAKVEGYEGLVRQYEDINTLIEMGNEEEDEEIVAEVKRT